MPGRDFHRIKTYPTEVTLEKKETIKVKIKEMQMKKEKKICSTEFTIRDAW